ncbi:MAG: DedA family protein [Deltaproteobacteria bacterium]|nr:DedA family protein [Deltaproteobacteria bacterium]
MEALIQLFDLFLHIDKYLDIIIRDYGAWTYGLLFVVVFCETGLVVTPFLPGDSLLFAAGVFAARGSLDVWLLGLLLFVAAVIGDAVNYAVGAYIGPKVFERKGSRIFRPEYLEKTRSFYNKYGSKTIVIARFVPIVRTFAPFLAGVGSMRYRHFAMFNVSGAVLWVVLFVGAGFLFGELEFVKKNFTVVIFAIILLSILPAAVEACRARRVSKASCLVEN